MPNFDDRDQGFMNTFPPKNDRAPNWRCSEIELSTELLTALINEAKAGRKPIIEIAGWEGQNRNGNTYIKLKLTARPPQAGQRLTGDRGDYQQHQGPPRREGREQLPPRNVEPPPRYERGPRQAPQQQYTGGYAEQGRTAAPQRGPSTARPPWEEQDQMNQPLPEDWK